MTYMPFMPEKNPRDDRIAAADPGQGAPPPAEGFGVHAEDSDVLDSEEDRPPNQR
jgi:hypothetical protein